MTVTLEDDGGIKALLLTRLSPDDAKTETELANTSASNFFMDSEGALLNKKELALDRLPFPSKQYIYIINSF